MDPGTTIALPIAFIALFIAGYSVIISRKTLRHQVLLDVRKDYRSAEMTSAIDELWEFYRDCNEKKKDDINLLKEEYKKRVGAEKAKISNSTDPMKVEDGLNYKRRLVTHFYSHLASINRYGILPPKMIFDWWLPVDLEMIENFIIPLQEASLEMHGVSKEHIKPAMQPLEKLKEDCDYYHDEENKVKKKLYFLSKRMLDFLRK